MLLRQLLTFFVLAWLAGCGKPVDPTISRDDSVNVAKLAQAIIALNPNVDPGEAGRAAKIAYSYTQQLAIAYEITDPPIIHNMKVNSGVRPRGLCWHWAEDMEARLRSEGFRTLSLHRAIANAFNPILIDHSTVIVSARGDTMEQGMVLDPWRYGGTLFWAPVPEDKRYGWVEREIVFARWRAGTKADADAEPITP